MFFRRAPAGTITRGLNAMFNIGEEVGIIHVLAIMVRQA